MGPDAQQLVADLPRGADAKKLPACDVVMKGGITSGVVYPPALPLRPGEASARTALAQDDRGCLKPKRHHRDQSGYSSLRQARGSSGPGFGVRSSRKELYGATNGSGAATV